MKLNTFRLTISVPGDLDDEVVKRVVSYCEKKCHYAYVVVEHGANVRRHLHAAVCLKVPMEGNNLLGYMWKIVQAHHPDALRRRAVNKHVMYDHAWYDEYLRKESDVEVHYAKYDKDGVAAYFPSEEAQTELMSVVEGAEPARIADKYYDRLEREWIEYSPDGSTFRNAVEFLNHIMFVARTERCIADTRRFSQVAYCLFRYRNKIANADAGSLRWYTDCTGLDGFR